MNQPPPVTSLAPLAMCHPPHKWEGKERRPSLRGANATKQSSFLVWCVGSMDCFACARNDEIKNGRLVDENRCAQSSACSPDERSDIRDLLAIVPAYRVAHAGYNCVRLRGRDESGTARWVLPAVLVIAEDVSQVSGRAKGKQRSGAGIMDSQFHYLPLTP